MYHQKDKKSVALDQLAYQTSHDKDLHCFPNKTYEGLAWYWRLIYNVYLKKEVLASYRKIITIVSTVYEYIL